MKPHHLESKLKTLRLGGMMDTLEIRLAQAQAEQLGYLAFLELLLEDEIARRAQNALAVRVRKARFEEVKTLAEFDFAYNPKIPAATIGDLATCRFVERKESVILCGPVGVGKSHIAQALGYAACQKGFHVLYVKTGRLLQDLGAATPTVPGKPACAATWLPTCSSWTTSASASSRPPRPRTCSSSSVTATRPAP